MLKRTSFLVVGFLGMTGIGCGEDSASRPAVLKAWADACDDPLESVYEAAEVPSPWTPELRGTIVRCAYERVITTAEMTAEMVDFGRVDPGFSSDVHKLRVSYWTERQDGIPALTSAALYIPETLRGGDESAPLVVFGHGSVGVGDQCAPSAESEAGFERDWKTAVYMTAGDGWLTVMPDFPGLGTEGPAAWMFSPDEAHSLLDATRAVRKLGPDVVGPKNALIGHSLGGHAVLSAQAEYEEYGADGSLDGVVIFNGFWLNNGAWAALVNDAGGPLLNSTFYALSLMYHYGHAAAYDGVEKATAMFQPEKADAIVDLLENKCWREATSDADGPPSIGLVRGGDGFLDEFREDAGNCAFNNDFCDGPEATIWRERWIADRPAPDTNIPVVHWIGGQDDFLTPDFQQCGIDRLEAQGAQQSVCVDPDGDHSGVLTRNADWTRQYFASVLLGEAAPEQCAGLEQFDRLPACVLPIPNGTEASDP